jgi:hypothetical protein
MLATLLLAAVSLAHSPDAALKICRPALARKADGQIDRITIETRSRWRSTTIIRGRLTVFVGMGAPTPGTASAHHLIRAEYRYGCWVQHGRVRKTTIDQY